MKDELKVGQRIEVYNCIENEFYYKQIKVGGTYIGKNPNIDLGLVSLLSKTPSDGGMRFYVMSISEVKKIGTFLIKRLHNTHPETII